MKKKRHERYKKIAKDVRTKYKLLEDIMAKEKCKIKWKKKRYETYKTMEGCEREDKRVIIEKITCEEGNPNCSLLTPFNIV